MTTDKDLYLQETPMLDISHASIQALVQEKGWKSLSTYEAIGAAYHYVRDGIRFGYNRDDTLKASEVLADGYGQCNTKGTLLMALLRALKIPCRFHGFTIYNDLQKGAIPTYLFFLAPEKIIHSWVEVYFDGKWIDLEGFILDQPYLEQVQKKFTNQCEAFKGYGVATRCLSAPEIDWKGSATYIQKEGIADDLGVFTRPDDFYRQQGSNLSGVKKWLFRLVVRHLMNRNVALIRRRGFPNQHRLSSLLRRGRLPSADNDQHTR